MKLNTSTLANIAQQISTISELPSEPLVEKRYANDPAKFIESVAQNTPSSQELAMLSLANSIISEVISPTLEKVQEIIDTFIDELPPQFDSSGDVIKALRTEKGTLVHTEAARYSNGDLKPFRYEFTDSKGNNLLTPEQETTLEDLVNLKTQTYADVATMRQEAKHIYVTLTKKKSEELASQSSSVAAPFHSSYLLKMFMTALPEEVQDLDSVYAVNAVSNFKDEILTDRDKAIAESLKNPTLEVMLESYINMAIITDF